MQLGLPQNYATGKLTLSPHASPDQSVGDFLSAFSSSPQQSHSKRYPVHAKSLIEVVWSDAHTTYNISLSRCLTMLDMVGVYTLQNGTTLYNATGQDIVNDIKTRKGSESANRLFYASRVRENAGMAIDAAQSILKTSIVGYIPTSSGSSDEIGLHNDLRKLLAPKEEWIALMVRTMTFGGISTCFHYSQKAWNQTLGFPINDAAIFAMIPVGITIIEGIDSIIIRNRGLTYMESMVLNMFLGWFRNLCFSMASELLFSPINDEVSINRTKETLLGNLRIPISIQELREGADSLELVSNSRLRIGAIAEIAGEACP